MVLPKESHLIQQENVGNSVILSLTRIDLISPIDFVNFKIDEKLFKDFNEIQRKHLVDLSKNIDKVQENVAKDISEEIFTPLSDYETAIERGRSLEG